MVREKETGYWSDRFWLVRPLLHSMLFGCLFWFISGIQVFAGIGIAIAGCVEAYLTLVRDVPLPYTLWNRIKSNFSPAIMLAVVILAPIPNGFILALADKGLLDIDFDALSAANTVAELFLFGCALGLLPVAIRMGAERIRAYDSIIFVGVFLVLIAIPATAGTIWFTTITAGSCLSPDVDCNRTNLMSDAVYVLDERGGPGGLNRLTFMFVRPAALGSQERFAELQVLYGKALFMMACGLSFSLCPAALALIIRRLNEVIRQRRAARHRKSRMMRQ